MPFVGLEPFLKLEQLNEDMLSSQLSESSGATEILPLVGKIEHPENEKESLGGGLTHLLSYFLLILRLLLIQHQLSVGYFLN